MQAFLDHIDWHSPQLATYWFKPSGYFRFVPGEFTELYVPHDKPDERGESREFTITSIPAEPLIGITTTFPAKDHRMSTFKRALKELPVGGRVQLAETKGDFVAPRDNSIPLLFVAGGVGITPVLSIISHLKDTDDKRTVTVLHSVSNTETLRGKELFETYGAVYLPTLTQPHKAWSGQTGRMSSTDILNHVIPQTLVYISGPDSMVIALKQELINQDIDAAQIVTDAFTGY